MDTDKRVRYQVGCFGAAGEWQPAEGYTVTHLSIESAEYALACLTTDDADRADPCIASRVYGDAGGWVAL